MVARRRRRTPTARCYADFAGIPEHRIRIIAPDIGGGFGNKVPIYPGYVCAIVGSMITGRPVKWAEDRTENLTASGFARDYIMQGEIAADRGTAGSSRSAATCWPTTAPSTAPRRRSKFPGGFFGVFTGSYDLEAAYCSMTAVHTNKAPGGVAYACSFRIAEAVYLVERLVDLLADELRRRPGRAAAAELPPARAVPLHEPHRLDLRLRRLRDRDARGAADRGVRRAPPRAGREARARRRVGQSLMGIGVSFFTEAVGAGPRKDDGHGRPRHGRRLRGPRSTPPARRSSGSR